MPVAEPFDAAPGANSRRAIPVHPRMPETRHIHHLCTALRRVALHMLQHVDDQLTTDLGLVFVPRRTDQPVTRCRTGNAEFTSQRRHHRPGTGLHHHFRNIPERLIFSNLAIRKPVEFMKAHMRQMPGRGNIQKWRGERADEMATAADPVGTGIITASHHQPVTSFDIRPCGLQRPKRPIIITLWPGHVTKGVGQPEQGVRCRYFIKGSANGGFVPVILGSTKHIKTAAIGCVTVTHSAALQRRDACRQL
ncbi:MAG: Uncharacterised protein [SAR116 cluster bacterium]|nr:MAG: Uncharacterised protein [SAR116 cluster bacterium]